MRGLACVNVCACVFVNVSACAHIYYMTNVQCIYAYVCTSVDIYIYIYIFIYIYIYICRYIGYWQ